MAQVTTHSNMESETALDIQLKSQKLQTSNIDTE